MAGRQREPWLQEILDGIREGRITQATAAAWLELGQAGQGRKNRYVNAAAPGEMSNEEADLLYPPRTAEEADRRAVRRTQAAAWRPVEEMSDEELHRLLFGDTTGEEAGCGFTGAASTSLPGRETGPCR